MHTQMQTDIHTPKEHAHTHTCICIDTDIHTHTHTHAHMHTHSHCPPTLFSHPHTLTSPTLHPPPCYPCTHHSLHSTSCPAYCHTLVCAQSPDTLGGREEMGGRETERKGRREGKRGGVGKYEGEWRKKKKGGRRNKEMREEEKWRGVEEG